jgi:transposase, IS30 family
LRSPTACARAGRRARSPPSWAGRRQRSHGRSAATAIRSRASTGRTRRTRGCSGVDRGQGCAGSPSTRSFGRSCSATSINIGAPKQIARQLSVEHGRPIAVETIYQALYCPERVLERDATTHLRTKRPYRRPRQRGDQRRSRFIAPITLIDHRPATAADRADPGHWEGDLIVGAFNRSAIGTLVERTSRFTLLVHIDGASRAEALRDRLIDLLGELPGGLRRSLTWDQGSEVAYHHEIAHATAMPVFLCHPGRPWERPSNENTNGLLRDYFPKGSDLRVHTALDLKRVADELNLRPRKTLGWQSPARLFDTLQARLV